jgi:hypothetical protein
VRVWWTQSPAAALELANAVALRPGMTTRKAEIAVRHAAGRLRIPLAEHDTTLAHARAALARLDHALKLATQQGTLWAFNQRFRYLRQKQPSLNYSRVHAQLKNEIARRLAESGGLPDLGGIVDAVLPLPAK